MNKHMEIPGDLDSLNVLQSIFLGGQHGPTCFDLRLCVCMETDKSDNRMFKKCSSVPSLNKCKSNKFIILIKLMIVVKSIHLGKL